MRQLRFFLVFWMTIAVMVQCWAQGDSPARKLAFLGNAQLPPIVWDSDGQAEGVAVDLVRAAARSAGLEIQISATDWAQAQLDLKDGKADALIQINPNAERLKIFDFSEPLLVSRFHIFHRNKDVGLNSLADLSGKRIGVEKAGFPAAYLKDYPQLNVVIVPSWGRGLQMLQEGQIDAVFVDRWVGEYEMFLHKVPDLAISEPPVVTLDSRIAVKKGDTELLSKINRGLSAIASDGTRQAILEKWEAKEVVYLTRESITHLITLFAVGLALVFLLVAVWLYRGHLRLERANAALQVSIADTSEAMNRAISSQSVASKLAAEQRVLLDTPVIGILKVKDRSIQWTNAAFQKMLGYSDAELLGQSTRIGYPSDIAFESVGAKAYQALAACGNYHFEQEMVRKDGSSFFAEVSGSMVQGSGNESIWCFSDITERHKLDERVHELAFHDVLTRLPNRTLFIDRLNQAIATSERTRQYGALLVLDLDNFKPLNDTHGHAAGDLLLMEVARRLSSSVREMDTVARFGGDEFAIIVGALAGSPEESIKAATAVAQKVLSEIAEPYLITMRKDQKDVEPIQHRCTASIGVALFLGAEASHEEIFRRADAAMYVAKNAGRNRIHFDAYLPDEDA